MSIKGQFLLVLTCSLFLLVVLAFTDWTLVPAAASPPVSDGEPPSVIPPALPSGADGSLSPNCRFGLAVLLTQTQEFDIVSNLGVGWYLDFVARPAPPGPTTAEYAQMVRLSQDRQGSDVCGPDYGYSVSPSLTPWGLGALVAANPGALWIVGNEPDRVGQDGVCPQQYAQAYHDVYHFIKSRDPTARVAIAGLVEVTPGRLQYLDIVWDTYARRYGAPMPVDVWTMHVYVLSETGDGDAHIALGTDPALAIPYSVNCADPNSYCHAEHDDIALFAQQVVRMRDWMARHGQRDRPLIITEYGILKPYHYVLPGDPPDARCTVEICPSPQPLYCFCDETNRTFHPRRVANFMEATFNYLRTATDPALGNPQDGNRLVQQWLWYSLATPDPVGLGHASNLVTPTEEYALTVQGQRWRNYVAALPPEVNFFPAEVPHVIAHRPAGASAVTVTLAATVRNGGNRSPDGPVAVTFYRDAGLTQPIGTATFAGLGGCLAEQVVVTATWANVGPGRHDFWVWVDSLEAVPEFNEGDNVGAGWVWVDPLQLFLPTVMRGR